MKFKFKLLIATGLGLAACGGLRYFFSRERNGAKKPKEVQKNSLLSVERLNEIIQYSKYHYFFIFEEYSKEVRKAKENQRYDETCREKTQKQLQDEMKAMDKKICDEYGISYKVLKQSIVTFSDIESVKVKLDTLSKAMEAALEGLPVSYESKCSSIEACRASDVISKEEYIAIYKRILWKLRKLAYVELQARMRADGGKLAEESLIKVKQLLVDSAGDIKVDVCRKAGIKATVREEYSAILQECYFEHNANPAFIGRINEEKKCHCCILEKVLSGKLIPQMEHLDIDQTTDNQLDDLNSQFMT